MNIPSMLRLAKSVAKLSDHRYPMAAIIIKNGKPISVGINQIKTNPNAPRTGLHAECHAIKCSGKYDLRGSSIVVYREKRNGSVGLARPCKYCLIILRERGFKYIHYTTNEFPFFESERI